MKKKFSVLITIALCVAMILSFAGCSTTDAGEEETDAFVAATIDVGDSLPVSTSEIIAFYNDIITKVQTDSNFTAENKPGLNTSESIRVDNLKVLAYDAATGEATEDDSLKALNNSAKAMKDRILGGIDTSIPVIPFGDMNTSFNTVIYPYGSAVTNLTADDVLKAESSADGNNLNIYIVLNNTAETVNNVFGTRDKAALIETLNTNCADYADINDYTVNYVADEENNTYSTISLTVELEQQDDGTYKCTGRITSFKINIIADVAANITCKGSFAEHGDVQLQFRFTDEKNYTFDWMGNANWEPTSEAA